MSVPRPNGGEINPEIRGQQPGLGKLFGLALVIALIVAALASGLSWFIIAEKCTDRIEEDTPQYAVCETLFRAQRNHNGASTEFPGDAAVEAFPFALPILLVLGGAVIGRRRQRPKVFWISAMLAVLVLSLPWVALALASL
jgi:hypothetical protein